MSHSVRIHPRLRRTWAVMLLTITLSVSAFAQQARLAIITLAERKVKDQADHLLSTMHTVPLKVDLQAFRAAASAGPELHLAAVPLSRGLSVDLDMKEYTVIEPDAILTVTTDAGTVALPAPTAHLYRGTVAGDPKSWAFLTISQSNVIGSITVNDKTYQIATDYAVASDNTTLSANAYPLADVYASDGKCAINPYNSLTLNVTKRSEEEIARLMVPLPQTSVQQDNAILYAVKGAFDADYEYLHDRFNGNKQQAEDYMVQLVGQMSAVYERDLACQISISYLNMWDSRSGGYPYVESSSMDAALYQANGYWIQSKPTVDRAFQHIFSGKPWVNPIGIAFVDVLCNKSTATAYSLITKNNPEQDIKVIAHETGHVFGSLHTHSCSWHPEVDRCAAAEEGTCFTAAQIVQSLGTIMSYCSQSELKFHDKGIVLLKNLLLQRPCVELSSRLTVNPLGIYFPNAEVNKPIDTILTAAFQNNSQKPIFVSKLTLAGTNAGDFSIIEPADTFTLRPGENKQLKLHYLATTEDPADATITIEHSGLNPPIVVRLEAYARAKQPVLGIIAGGKKEIDFKTHRVGEVVDTTMKTVFANIGTALLRASNTEVTGPDRFEFQMTEGTAPFQIESGDARLAASFRFAPTSVGTKVAYVLITSNSKGGGVDTLTLRGTAKVGPRLTFKVSQLSVNFKQRQPKIAADTLFSEFFFNSGSDTLEIIGDIEGTDAASFNANIGIIDLAPGEAYNLPITFFDSVPGQKRAYIVVNQADYETQTIYRRDTIYLLGEIVGPSAVPGGRNESETFSIAPNPASGDVIATIAPLPGEAGGRYTLTIIDAAGRTVRTITDRFGSRADHVQIATAGLAAGSYYLRLDGPKGRRQQSLTIVR